MRAVCHIPNVECLTYGDLNRWVGRFKQRSGFHPTDVVLPAFTEIGPTYHSKYGPQVKRKGEELSLTEWTDGARKALDDVTVWALVNLELPSLVNSMVTIRDQWNRSVAETCCIVNPRVQVMLREIFQEIKVTGVDGVVLDATDIYPNSTSEGLPGTSNGIQPLQNSCFCQYCVKDLESRAKWDSGSTEFREVETNIARFVLKPSKRGTTPITVGDELMADLSAKGLTSLACAKGFVEVADGPEGRQLTEKQAAKVIRYMVARSKVTALALKQLRDFAADQGLRASLVLGSSGYDQSQAVNLTALIRLSSADEYWIEGFEDKHLAMEDAPPEWRPDLLRVMARRGTYYINSLFSHLEKLSELRELDLTNRDIEVRFRSVCEGLEGLDSWNQLNLGQCAQIPNFEGLAGFMGVPVSKQDVLDIIDAKADDGTMAMAIRNEIFKRQGSGGRSIEGDASMGTDGTWD
jgi:hypothetical protein